MPTVYVGAALGVFKTLKEAFATVQAGTAAAASSLSIDHWRILYTLLAMH
jgi:1,4-dihydroxy-2-naphthoate octaprenyltransferase